MRDLRVRVFVDFACGRENGFALLNLHPKVAVGFPEQDRKAGEARRGGIMTETKKCDNPACSCVPPDNEKYCSAHCEAMGSTIEVVCLCGDGHCGGNAA